MNTISTFGKALANAREGEVKVKPQVNTIGIESIWNDAGKGSPLENPVNSLYGFIPEDNAGGQFDMEDFSKNVSDKKEIFPVALTKQEIMEAIEDGISLSKEMELSVFQQEDWTSMLIKLKDHYGRTCVPGGFDWAIRLVNLKPVLNTLGLPIPTYWDLTILVAFAIIYEGLGLGGLSYEALEFHTIMKNVASGRNIQDKDIKIFAPQLMEVKMLGGTDKDFAFKVFKEVLPKDLSVTLLMENVQKEIFDLLFFSATCRAMVSKFKKGKSLSNTLLEFETSDLTNEIIQFLALCGQVLRDGAKGYVEIEETPLIFLLKENPVWTTYVQSLSLKQKKGIHFSVSEMNLMWASHIENFAMLRQAQLNAL